MQTEVKFDCCLEFPPIVDVLATPTSDEIPDLSNGDGDKQTKMTGIISPLVKLNNTTIAWSNVVSMTLTDNIVPKITLEINDKLDLQRIYDRPDADNRLQIQILPAFDNAYKKINLMFLIDRISFDNGIIFVSGTYNVPGWNNNTMKSFGYSSTYEFFESVAHILKLGYCSNIDGTEDKRWIYMPNTKYLSTLQQEVDFGGNQNQLLCFWIDYWNNINLVDVYERYTTIDEDIFVWVQNSVLPQTDENSENPPQRVEAMISNHPSMQSNPLFTRDCELLSNLSLNVSNGSDKICEVYNMNTLDTESYLVMDGSIKKNVIVSYNYLGEEFGDHNYLANSIMKRRYMQKINTQKIKVNLKQPCLGLTKGSKVNFYWYEVNGFIPNELNKEKISSNIPIPNNETEGDPDAFLPNMELSGQYYITECNFMYENYGNMPVWNQELILSRRADDIEKLVTDEDRPLDKSSFDDQAPIQSTASVADTEENSNFINNIYDSIESLSNLTENL